MPTQQKSVLAALAVSILTLAGGPAIAGGGHGNEGYIAAYDTNGDGVVTSAEIIAVRTADFSTYDADSSSLLSLAEYQNLEDAVQTRRLAAAFTALDTDSSSTLTLAEFTANASTASSSYWSNVFALADTDSSATLTQAEFSALYDHDDHSGILSFARFDTDYSQTLTLAEYTTVTSRSSHTGGKGKGRH
ncbi:MAG: hypothetical protein KDI44_02030 [Thiothrix sp.]|nr:hypothetical protein [Thiothrix sp.]HPQ94592.1 hypothetical protein [Thiolinea sp.]